MKNIVVILSLCFYSVLAHAECEGLAEKLNVRLYGTESGMAKDMSFSACKVWTFDPSKTIVVMAHHQASNLIKSSQDYSEGLYDLTVLLVNSNSSAIVNMLFQKGVLSSDAIRLNNVIIDTAPYNLGQNKRAFGVRAKFGTLSSVGSWEHSQLGLYIPREKKLDYVLGRIVVENKVFQPVDDCIEKLTDITRTLSISKASNLGYADLMVKEKVIVDEGKREKSECNVTKKIFTKNYVLRFNGEKYVVPVELEY